MLLTFVGALVALVLLSSVTLWLKSRPQTGGARSSAGPDSSWVCSRTVETQAAAATAARAAPIAAAVTAAPAEVNEGDAAERAETAKSFPKINSACSASSAVCS